MFPGDPQRKSKGIQFILHTKHFLNIPFLFPVSGHLHTDSSLGPLPATASSLSTLTPRRPCVSLPRREPLPPSQH